KKEAFLPTEGENPTPPPAADPSGGPPPTTADLNLRAGPDLGATVLTVIPSGGAVTVLGDNQNGYSRVSYGGTTGWTHASYLTSGGGAPAPEVEPEARSFSGPTGSAVTTADLNLRAGPNTSSEVLTVMAYGAIVSLTGRTQNSFHAIRHQGTEGWAHSDYLSIGTVPAPVPAQPTPAAPTPDAVPSQGPTGTAYTTAELNLRSGPSTSTGVVAVMPYGAALTVTGQRQAGFYSVSYSGTSGWAYATYLTTNAPAPAPTAPTPAPAAGSGGSGATDIVAIIYAAADRYGQPRADMLRVARCESLLDPNAVNPAGSYGLFQFIPSTWASTPYAAYDIFDPWASANAAGWMWSVGRRGEWTCQ
ncbi:MAG: SH3 domain-containing protein, partial [Thermomicrobiales bacterium]